ncbi:amino acid adenylation domain-containing protein, partial [Shewanella surugensis]
NIALVFEGSELTYDELNQRANQLAHHIRSQYQELHQTSLKPDTLIALYLDRSLEMVISILAVLKAGGAYVPIAPEYPQARTVFMLEDTTAPFIITQSHYEAQLTEWFSAVELDCTVLPVNGESISNNDAGDENSTNENSLAAYPVDNLISVNQSSDLAYVIYTSGTTGQPKGVMIEHKSVINLTVAQREKFKVDGKQRALFYAAYVFDASVFELFVSLSGGHSIFICSHEERLNVDLLLALIHKQAINIATLPPILMNERNVHQFYSLDTLVLAGESPSLALLSDLSQHCHVFNAYGPTEGTVCATAHLYQEGDLATNIGHGMANYRLYPLNRAYSLSPIGTLGELCIGGAGLARGYLNRPELTTERFIHNPFASEDDIERGYTRLYQTGDLVRYLSDGNLAYLGRNDEQVKIRGHRIELGEIEAALVSLEGIQQAVVIDRPRVDSQGKYLAAYLTCATTDDEVDVFEQDKLDVDDIRSQLSERLPDYMLPLTFTVID